MLARMQRLFYRIACFAGAVAVLTLIYFNIAFNRASAQAFFVDVSSLVLLVLFFIVAARYASLIWFAYLQHIENTNSTTTLQDVPLVSVIVPAFNEGKLILASVESLLKQDYPLVEIIIVDDGSTDGTAGVLARRVADVA